MAAVVPEFLQPFMLEMPYHEDNVTSNMTYDKYFFVVRCQIDEFGIGWIYKTALPEPLGSGSVYVCGVDGTRTRDSLRDRQVL